MNPISRISVYWAIASALVWISGCDSKSDGLSPVTGQVTLDGEPLSTGTVITVPQGGRGARGEIDSTGHFTLQTAEVGEGATPGVHRVGVKAYATTGKPQGLENEFRSLIPDAYGNPYDSGLTINVKPGEPNDVTLELSSHPNHR